MRLILPFPAILACLYAAAAVLAQTHVASPSTAPPNSGVADQVLPGVPWADFQTFGHPLFDGFVNVGTNAIALLVGICLLLVGLVMGLAYFSLAATSNSKSALEGCGVCLVLPSITCFFPVKYAACLALTLLAGVFYVPFWLLGGARVTLDAAEL